MFGPLEKLFLFLVLLATFVMVGAGVRQAYEHRQYLRQHGCQLLVTAPTGRHVGCGKGCTRQENVYVYDCADGTRTEVY